MAYKVIILYQLYMPSYFLGTFTEYPYMGIFYVPSIGILTTNAWYIKYRYVILGIPMFSS